MSPELPKRLIEIFEAKIKDKIQEVWGSKTMTDTIRILSIGKGMLLVKVEKAERFMEVKL